jgi:ATP-binding cassette subfamily B protein
MKFEGGKTYALVGHNGAGKSTIIKLLLRFYDPTEGEILLNGRNIKEYNLQKYRALFATAFQDNRMFSMSVADNVTLGEDIPAEKREAIVTEALKLSGVYQKVMSLPQGINTTLTREFDDQGAVLSGGEFQKIVVSRAFARRCPVKVFDEPSSALDPIAEYELNKAMESAAKGKTVFYISHRLSTTRDADRIIMLERGRIIEEGTHTELLARNGKYAEMWNAQAGKYN